MALASSSAGTTAEPPLPNPFSPERNQTRSDRNPSLNRTVAVVYYLSRNGLLEHPHFIEVPLSSPNGLFLKDFINRLDSVRGKGMGLMYSWSSKRSYKNGFVWQDLIEDDLILPSNAHDYVLKGSELFDPPPPPPPPSRAPKPNALDPIQYKVYKAEPTPEIAGKAADAATQTDDQSPRRRDGAPLVVEPPTTELSGGEISPPPSSSSSEMTPLGGDAGDGSARIVDRAALNHPSGRMRASAVLRQLISCGSVVMDGQDEPPMARLSRGPPRDVVPLDTEGGALTRVQ